MAEEAVVQAENENIETIENIEVEVENNAAESIDENIGSADVKESEENKESKNKIERNLRKQRVGIVVSNKMNKTVVVKIEERVRHPKYNKIMKRSIKLKAHDEKNECDIGDKILVMETRPLSKDKRWRLVEILEKVK